MRRRLAPSGDEFADSSSSREISEPQSRYFRIDQLDESDPCNRQIDVTRFARIEGHSSRRFVDRQPTDRPRAQRGLRGLTAVTVS